MADRKMFAKFAGTCTVCHTAFPAGTLVLWAKGAGAKHADAAVCAAAAAKPKPVVKPAPALSMKGVVDFLSVAKEHGLKYPKVRFLAPGGGEVRLSVAGDKSRVPGSVQVVVRDVWVGRVEPDGKVVGGKLVGDAAMLDLLTTVAADPATAARAYGALMGRCSFCNLPLTDAFSVEHGYGPVCAKRFGLEHHRKGAPVLKPVPDFDGDTPLLAA